MSIANAFGYVRSVVNFFDRITNNTIPDVVNTIPDMVNTNVSDLLNATLNATFNFTNSTLNFTNHVVWLIIISDWINNLKNNFF